MIKIKCKRTGKIFDNDMSKAESIIEIHFCTSYTQVIVQEPYDNEYGKKIFPQRSIILPPEGGKLNFVDLIAIKDDAEGEWI